MEQERRRAAKIGYDDPVNASFEATTEMYHEALEHAMSQISAQGVEKKKIAVMVASHNEDTVRFAVRKYVVLLSAAVAATSLISALSSYSPVRCPTRTQDEGLRDRAKAQGDLLRSTVRHV